MEIRGYFDIRGIFFDNRTVKQTIFKNAFWTALASGVSKILKLALLIYVARVLGATEYGKFTFALAFISLFVVFSDLGLSSIITREFAREKERQKDFYSIISLKALLGLATLLIILGGSFLITSDPAIRKAIWILAIFSSIGNFSEAIYAFFRARQRMEYVAWSLMLESLVVAGIGLFIIFNFPSVINLSYSYLLSVIISLIFILVLFRLKFFSVGVSLSKEVWKRFLKLSWPLALASLFGTIYVYIDSVMMGHWGLITETGWYNAAYKVIITTSILMGIIESSFYPAMSKFLEESKEKLQKVWDYQMELMIVLALPLMVGGFLLAPEIIGYLYGSEYFPSVLAFQILIVMAGTVYLSAPLSQVLVVFNQQEKIFWTTCFGAGVNVILNLFLIPRFSLYGAAGATVITYLLIMILFFFFSARFTSIHPLNLRIFLSTFVALLASIVMYFIVSLPQIYNLNIFISVLIGGTGYLAAFILLRSLLNHSLNYLTNSKL